MKKIKATNYIIAIIIMVLTIVATYMVSKMYLDSKALDNENDMSYLAQLQPDELDSYIIDNHNDVMLYITNSETTNKDIDKQVKKILINNDYTRDTIYINLNNCSSDFYDDFATKYGSKKELLTNNTLIFIRDLKAIKTVNLNERNIKHLKDYIDKFYGEE